MVVMWERLRSLLAEAPITFGTVPIYEAYNSAIEKYKNPMKMTEDDFLRAFENATQKMELTLPSCRNYKRY